MKKYCQCCKRLIIIDWEEWKKNNKEEHYIQCPYCLNFEEIE